MDDPWLEALAEAAGRGAEAAGRGAEAAAGAIPPATRFARRNWRRSKKLNEERVGRSAFSALNEIADNAAIDMKNRDAPPRSQTPRSWSAVLGQTSRNLGCMLPRPRRLWASVGKAFVELGVWFPTLSNLSSSSLGLKPWLLWRPLNFVTGKFGWDETGLRVMMPNERVQELFEELKCDDMPDDDEEKADQEAQDIDAALADGGGRKGMSRVLLQIMQKKLSVCAGGIEGAITPFPSFMRSVTAGEIYANIVAGSQLKDVELRAKDRSPKKSRRRSVRLNRKRIRR